MYAQYVAVRIRKDILQTGFTIFFVRKEWMHTISALLELRKSYTHSQQTLRDKKLESYDVQGARGIDTRFWKSSLIPSSSH